MAFRGTGGIPNAAPDTRLHDERAEALLEVLNSDGWLRVAVPSLRRRQAALERAIAGSNEDLPEMRRLQGEWKCLDSILRDPRSYFDVEER